MNEMDLEHACSALIELLVLHTDNPSQLPQEIERTFPLFQAAGLAMISNATVIELARELAQSGLRKWRDALDRALVDMKDKADIPLIIFHAIAQCLRTPKRLVLKTFQLGDQIIEIIVWTISGKDLCVHRRHTIAHAYTDLEVARQWWLRLCHERGSGTVPPPPTVQRHEPMRDTQPRRPDAEVAHMTKQRKRKGYRRLKPSEWKKVKRECTFHLTNSCKKGEECPINHE